MRATVAVCVVLLVWAADAWPNQRRQQQGWGTGGWGNNDDDNTNSNNGQFPSFGGGFGGPNNGNGNNDQSGTGDDQFSGNGGGFGRGGMRGPPRGPPPNCGGSTDGDNSGQGGNFNNQGPPNQQWGSDSNNQGPPNQQWGSDDNNNQGQQQYNPFGYGTRQVEKRRPRHQSRCSGNFTVVMEQCATENSVVLPQRPAGEAEKRRGPHGGPGFLRHLICRTIDLNGNDVDKVQDLADCVHENCGPSNRTAPDLSQMKCCPNHEAVQAQCIANTQGFQLPPRPRHRGEEEEDDKRQAGQGPPGQGPRHDKNMRHCRLLDFNDGATAQSFVDCMHQGCGAEGQAPVLTSLGCCTRAIKEECANTAGIQLLGRPGQDDDEEEETKRQTGPGGRRRHGPRRGGLRHFCRYVEEYDEASAQTYANCIRQQCFPERPAINLSNCTAMAECPRTCATKTGVTLPARPERDEDKRQGPGGRLSRGDQRFCRLLEANNGDVNKAQTFVNCMVQDCGAPPMDASSVTCTPPSAKRELLDALLEILKE